MSLSPSVLRFATKSARIVSADSFKRVLSSYADLFVVVSGRPGADTVFQIR